MNEAIPNSLAIPDPQPLSPYENLLGLIYSTTPGPITLKIDQMLNVALVVLNIRTGAIISTNEIEYVVGELRKMGLLAKEIIYSKQTRIRSIILANPMNPNIEYFFNELPAEPPDLNNRANNVKRNKQDVDIGHILGYVNPIPIWQYLGKPAGNIRINVTIKDSSGSTYSIQVFPQRFLDMTDSVQRIVDTMAEEIRTVQLPLGFTIESVEKSITPPPSQGGSRRRRFRKSQRRRKTRKYRS